MSEKLIPAKIKAIYLHPTQKVPVIFVTDKKEHVVIPMIIGFLEAQAILIVWQGFVIPRPVTADLLRTIIEEDFQATVKQIVITEISDSAYRARIDIKIDQTIIMRDSRPSDALALAVRTKAPIYLTQTIIEQTKQEQENTQALLGYLEEEGIDSEEIIKF